MSAFVFGTILLPIWYFSWLILYAYRRKPRTEENFFDWIARDDDWSNPSNLCILHAADDSSSASHRWLFLHPQRQFIFNNIISPEKRFRKWVGFHKPKLASFSQGSANYSMNTATAPVWQSEIAKPSWRGKLVVLETMCVSDPTSNTMNSYSVVCALLDFH
jgi:hypothetical protein